ncbi:non-hydrolyzing UDP-N-acetylglucosamine 2-epimerase [Desulfoplanes formicivorans]|uniref:UDP-N-acetylglucosamine 2-epimerase n=1 Tax=Desulfoplanes formicivorans TaxID=1592317 RepID=A0A194AFS0_9BACT|nr:UDP-N-acetylglucosamine 2-epimerase (non-hydrolyzing) [Desulfoplanes formicivorans]GAU07619.1 UDP-N-acetylglucosamine 2-epimerase [Desulfoplanes formicivorans]
MKILTIVGARPQFIKAAMVSRAIIAHNEQLDSDNRNVITEVILHTGQHYDDNMSRIFFDQMGIPKPACNLQVGSGTHGDTTGKMLGGIEKVILDEEPDWVLVYGDTNSTLAGALAASKLHVPVAHVEAGLRSFNKKMPEEINRILTDHVSSLLFCPTTTAVKNLANEGITDNVHHVGDVMYDAALVFGEIAEKQSKILCQLSLLPKSYYLATVHRAENTDNFERLKNIFDAFCEIATEDCPIILPLHPRTKKALLKIGLAVEKDCLTDNIEFSTPLEFANPHVKATQPISFLDMVMLEKNAKAIMTDSGGVQKEAYFHKVPCVTLRDETEWVETVDAGWNKLVGADKHMIMEECMAEDISLRVYHLYGKGNGGEQIVSSLFC